jgi:hypothetical protein
MVVLFKTSQSESPASGIRKAEDKCTAGFQAVGCFGKDWVAFIEILEHFHANNPIELAFVEIRDVAHNGALNASFPGQCDSLRVFVDQRDMVTLRGERTAEPATASAHIQDSEWGRTQMTQMVEHKSRLDICSVSSDAIAITLRVLHIPDIRYLGMAILYLGATILYRDPDGFKGGHASSFFFLFLASLRKLWQKYELNGGYSHPVRKSAACLISRMQFPQNSSALTNAGTSANSQSA